MPKSPSPVRLQQDLMQAASIAGERQHRSAAEQIEYWASIGRSVSGTLTPDNLLAITTGLVNLKVEPVVVPNIDPESVFNSLEYERDAGTLRAGFSGASSVRYQASVNQPGLLEQIHSDGNVRIGRFSNGVFVEQSI